MNMHSKWQSVRSKANSSCSSLAPCAGNSYPQRHPCIDPKLLQFIFSSRCETRMLGCRQHARRDDNRHNRLPGVCKFPLDVSIEWTCEACVQHKHSKDRKHTLKAGECQWASAPTRATASRKSQKTAPDGPELQEASHPPNCHLGDWVTVESNTSTW